HNRRKSVPQTANRTRNGQTKSVTTRVASVSRRRSPSCWHCACSDEAAVSETELNWSVSRRIAVAGPSATAYWATATVLRTAPTTIASTSQITLAATLTTNIHALTPMTVRATRRSKRRGDGTMRKARAAYAIFAAKAAAATEKFTIARLTRPPPSLTTTTAMAVAASDWTITITFCWA